MTGRKVCVEYSSAISKEIINRGVKVKEKINKQKIPFLKCLQQTKSWLEVSRNQTKDHKVHPIVRVDKIKSCRH